MNAPPLFYSDNFLSADQHERLRLCLIHQWGPPEQESSWFAAEGMQASLLPLPALDPVIDLLGRVWSLFQLDLRQPAVAGGLEWWINRNTSHVWHLDKDETLLHRSRKLRTAYRSFLYYVQQPFSGGELELMPSPLLPPDGYVGRTQQIEPRQGRLISFDSRIYHRVRPYRGDRLSIAMNAWLEPPLMFSDHSTFFL